MFEQVYDKRFFLREPSVELWADAQFKLFGEGTKGVVLGKQGWLYTNQEYRVPNDLQANLNTQLEQIAKIKTQLAEREQHTGGAPNQTEVVMLEAHLLGIEELDQAYMASVEFSGLIREDASSGPNPFREVWNITRPQQGPGGWLVAGVQALQ